MPTSLPPRSWRCGALALLAVLALVAPGAAQPEEPVPGANEVPVPEDLLAVLTLRGKPCGAVTDHERLGETDYRVTCRDGHRYRVYVGADGRVVVEELR